MTGLLATLFMLNSFHINYQYEPKTYELVRQLAVLSVNKLDHGNCYLTRNYYADENTFAYEEQCQDKIGKLYIYPKKIVVIDINQMTFHRYSETEFE